MTKTLIGLILSKIRNVTRKKQNLTYLSKRIILAMILRTEYTRARAEKGYCNNSEELMYT